MWQNAREAALREEEKWSGCIPPYPGLQKRAVSHSRQLSDLSLISDESR